MQMYMMRGYDPGDAHGSAAFHSYSLYSLARSHSLSSLVCALRVVTRLWDGRLGVDGRQLGDTDTGVLGAVLEEVLPRIERLQVLGAQPAQIVGQVRLEAARDERARGVAAGPEVSECSRSYCTPLPRMTTPTHIML